MINYTELRHEMLISVSKGEVRCDGGPWIFNRRVTTQSQMARAMNGLWHEGYVAIDEDRVVNGRVDLTPVGQAALSQWNSGNRS
jgi:hypothetical protein